MGVGGQRKASAASPPGKRPCAHFIGGWVGIYVTHFYSKFDPEEKLS